MSTSPKPVRQGAMQENTKDVPRYGIPVRARSKISQTSRTRTVTPNPREVNRHTPMTMKTLFFALPAISPLVVLGWTPAPPPHLARHRRSAADAVVMMNSNMLSDIGDMLTGGKLVPQKSLPYGKSLTKDVTEKRRRTFAIQERLVSWTGEDFDVHDLDTNRPYVTVKGAMLHLPGKDKMRIVSNKSGQELAVLERKLLASKPTYDIYRGGSSEKIGWIEKAALSLTDTFDFHAQAEQGGLGPFKPPPAYKFEGDFLSRRFVVKNAKGEVVAKVSKDRLVEFDAFDHYQVQVAPGMDPVLVIACACTIDEEFDEEHKKKKQIGRE